VIVFCVDCENLFVFEKVEKTSKMLNPLKGFVEDSVRFEYRKDPLTGRNSTVIGGMLGYVGKFLVSDRQMLDGLVEGSRVGCPFCPESVKSRTPMFVSGFVDGGRFVVGDVVVVPNLMGHAERSVLAVLGGKHHLKLGEFHSELVLDGFRGGAAYLRRLLEVEGGRWFPAFVFNYLPPAGSSILHPHMQILARDRPFYLTGLMLRKSRSYFAKYGRSFWTDLLETEKGGERYLFGKGRVEWLVPFAPLRGMNEVQAIVRGRSNLLELTDEDWRGLAEGVSRVLRFYGKEGYSSFNVAVLSGPLGRHLDYFDVGLRMINRPGVQPTCFTDAWAVPYLLWDGEVVEAPEQFAKRVKTFLSDYP